MSEYIKKEDAENIVLGSCDESALWKLRHIPPADVVEVVRCKDCKYGEWKVSELDNKTKGYECAIHAVFENDFGDNGFCSYGEREDNEDK